MNKKFFSVVILFFKFSECAKILGLFQVPSHSHQGVFQPIWKELSLRGHNVTVITPSPLNDPNLVNLTEIDVGYVKKLFLDFNFEHVMSKNNTILSKIRVLTDINFAISEAIFQNEEFRKIYNNPNEHFDLILIQVFKNPVFHSIGARFRAPVVGISSFGVYFGTNFAVGNPNHPALYPEIFFPYPEMNFWERWSNSFYYLWLKFYLNFEALPKWNEMAKRYLGNNIPLIEDLEKNMSALFFNNNPIIYTPRPNIPTMIGISQLHVKPPKFLPKDLQELLDKAREGIIYFSLGSNVQSVNMPSRFREVLIETFAELPYTVLWKWESDHLPRQPKNVITRKWLPQQDVLAHPNIKVFVTQCGLQSLEEAFSRGVPIVGVPFIADQEMNIKRLERFGVGLGVDYHTVTKEELKAAILEVAQNKKYREKTKELNDILNDHPQTSLDRVMWWCEYIIRHKGTQHLRSPTVDLSWFNFLLIDVVGATLIVLFISGYIVTKVVRMFLCCLFSKEKFKKN